MKLENIKIKVTPKNTAKVQKALFSTGVNWGDGGNEVNRAHAPYLFVNGNGKLTYQTKLATTEWFKNHAYQEVTVGELLKLTDKGKG